jgi:hypothetical protein
MKLTMLLTLIMSMLLLNLTALSEEPNDSYTLVINYPEIDFLDNLFAQNTSNDETEAEEEQKEIKMEIVIPENAGEVDMDEINRKINEAMKRVDEATSDLDSISGRGSVSININTSRRDTPYMGVVFDDLTLSQANDLGYNKFYGVLITRVVPDSPARAHRLLPDDILMEIDDQRVTNKRIFSNIVDSYNIGDTVKLKLFRNRQEMVMDFTFGSREGESGTGEVPSERRKPKIDLGDGGGGWIPVWYTPELDDINDLIAELGFSRLDDSGQFLNGGGLKGNIGNGLFLGGMLVGYTLERKIGHETNPEDPANSESVIRRMRYNVRYGGITLEQRIGITRKLITSVGSMLGWGRTAIEVSQNKGDHLWGNIPEDLDASVNNHLYISKNHIFLQPKIELFYRITDWLSLRGEVGYIYSYSYHSGWKAMDAGDVYEVTNSPDTSFSGMTVSVGPWFGF